MDPGDWVFADGDGILVVPRRRARAAVIAARMLNTSEQRLRARLESGEDLADVVGLRAVRGADGVIRHVP